MDYCSAWGCTLCVGHLQLPLEIWPEFFFLRSGGKWSARAPSAPPGSGVAGGAVGAPAPPGQRKKILSVIHSENLQMHSQHTKCIPTGRARVNFRTFLEATTRKRSSTFVRKKVNPVYAYAQATPVSDKVSGNITRCSCFCSTW